VTAQPSTQARELVRGGYDTHVHVFPDVVERRIDDLGLARRCQEVGLAGFILKSHYTSTAERATVVRRAVPGVQALGAISLNRAVGGLNPLAVEIAAREGARVVWMPTVDAVNEARAHDAPPGSSPPVWMQLQQELQSQGIPVEPVAVVDGAGEVVPEMLSVLSAIARHGLVLATGHLSRDEIFAVVDAAIKQGVHRIVITHPDFPSQSLAVVDQCALADRGALLERCLTTPHTGKVAWQTWIDNIRATGAEHNLVSSDLGQVSNPAVEDGLALIADRLLGAGFKEAEIHTMAVTNTRLVAQTEMPSAG
jgi:hypothetical protein